MISTPRGFTETEFSLSGELQTSGSCEDSSGHMQRHPEISKAGGNEEAQAIGHVRWGCSWLEFQVLKTVMLAKNSWRLPRTAKHMSHQQPPEMKQTLQD